MIRLAWGGGFSLTTSTQYLDINKVVASLKAKRFEGREKKVRGLPAF